MDDEMGGHYGNNNHNNGYNNSSIGYPVADGYNNGYYGGVPNSLHMHYPQMGQMHDQGSAYWSMHMNAYQYGQSSSQSTSYYGHYDNYHAPRMEYSRRAWEYPSMAIAREPISVDFPPEQDTLSVVHSIPEEPEPMPEDAVNSEVVWQDEIDPDNMTYEELLDLGEAVGTESRGLSQELINMLPTTKFKSGGIFSRKKSEERCVICQMRYKRGDHQIHLPCKHAYHTDCGSKWLSINKTCPVCNTEVFGDGSRR